MEALMNDSLCEEVQEVLRVYPQLKACADDESYIIEGKFVLNSEYQGIPLYDEYTIEVTIPRTFPQGIPRVRETSASIDRQFEHRYDSGELCLGATCDLVDFLDQHFKLVDFFSGPLTSYFYSASYFRRYKTVPYGERSHGTQGIVEAYFERYDVTDIELLVRLLAYVVDILPYRGHSMCPCGSGRALRKCHGKRILADITSHRVEIFKSDAVNIITWYFEQRKDRQEHG